MLKLIIDNAPPLPRETEAAAVAHIAEAERAKPWPVREWTDEQWRKKWETGVFK